MTAIHHVVSSGGAAADSPPSGKALWVPLPTTLRAKQRRAPHVPTPSTAKHAEIGTLWKDDLAGVFGPLPRESMSRVDAALGVALALPAAGAST